MTNMPCTLICSNGLRCRTAGVDTYEINLVASKFIDSFGGLACEVIAGMVDEMRYFGEDAAEWECIKTAAQATLVRV